MSDLAIVGMSFGRVSLGPVQRYIESARTVRDLWSGSYILSWLTAAGIAAVLKEGLEIESPGGAKDNPLVRFHLDTVESSKLLYSCLPNTFTCIGDDEDSVGRAVSAAEKAMRTEWSSICTAVKKHLDRVWQDFDWAKQWEEQLGDFWDIRTSTLPSLSDEEALREAAQLQLGEIADAHKARLALVGALESANKLIRHVPPNASKDDTRPKCAQTGEHAQMGPIAREDKDEDQMQVSREFWEAAAPEAQASWERLQGKDRFGAPALVKRFAWSQYFAGKFQKKASDKRVWDTATTAAASWIADDQKEGGDYLHERADAQNSGRSWSGQWLHLNNPDDSQKEEEHCPLKIWELIKQARERAKEQKRPTRPPAYYAILMMDGDNMGDHLIAANRDQARQIGQLLQKFALRSVPDATESFLDQTDPGQPVYAGGDDVLALLPMHMHDRSVVECAHGIQRKFAEELNPLLSQISAERKAAMSAGIALVHYKHDLRDALRAARNAEKAAKSAGKNCLAITAVRRSGERATAIVSWEYMAEIDWLLKSFLGGMTDRWSYHLREVIRMMTGGVEPEVVVSTPQLSDMIDLELHRLLHHGEAGKENAKVIYELWQSLSRDDRGGKDEFRRRLNALTLMQTASFMARGGREDR